jgi:hypothetical protein
MRRVLNQAAHAAVRSKGTHFQAVFRRLLPRLGYQCCLGYRTSPVPPGLEDPSRGYLHYLFDLWADVWRRKVAKGDVIIVRYADDVVLGFQHRADACDSSKRLRNGWQSSAWNYTRIRHG